MSFRCCAPIPGLSRRRFLSLAAAVCAVPALVSRPASVRAASLPRLQSQDGAPLALVEIQVLQNPSPFPADGEAHLLYELHLTSFQRTPLNLTAIEVTTAGGSPAPVARFADEALAGMIVPAGAAEPPAEPLRLLPGVRHMAFLELTFPAMQQVPATLAHTLVFAAGPGESAGPVSRRPLMEVLPQPPIVIGPPVYGDRWVAVNAASNTSIHRRTPLVVNGQLYFAQRYAIDLIQLDATGQPYQGDPARNENWLCHGQPLLAVADGVVLEVRDGIPENVPNQPPVVPISLDTVAGNYAVLDLGNGRYADYAHMIPGSVRVRPGGVLRQGDVVGLLGNSGNSTAPHLHFHVTDGPSFVGADGVPYAFDRIGIRKIQVEETADGGFRIDGLDTPARQARGELLLENDLVDFGQP